MSQDPSACYIVTLFLVQLYWVNFAATCMQVERSSGTFCILQSIHINILNNESFTPQNLNRCSNYTLCSKVPTFFFRGIDADLKFLDPGSDIFFDYGRLLYNLSTGTIESFTFFSFKQLWVSQIF